VNLFIEVINQRPDMVTPSIQNTRARTADVIALLLFLTFIYQSCKTLEEESPLLMSVDHMEFISEGSYKFTGDLVSLGDSEIRRYGLCWSESGIPDLSCSLKELNPVPASPGAYSVTVSGLLPSTTYYFRAFAVLDAATVYSELKEFTTRPAAEHMVEDVHGNIYRTIKIGKQTWMAENLKVTRYPDGTAIPLAEDSAVWFHFNRESHGYCWPGNVLAHGYAFGALYSWPAAAAAHEGITAVEEGVQGVCPDGWHLPSDEEWKQLEEYLGMSREEADADEWRGTDQGAKLKVEGIGYWKAPNAGAIDEVGFSAQPGGFRHGSAQFLGTFETARFWTSTQNGYGYAWYRRIDYDHTDVYRDFSGVYRGHSVRCVKDN
jgi:uncharacterized protein (TIGR02145 family)